MAQPATTKQKQYLKRLGYAADPNSLTKERASQQIDILLTQERESGRQFPCPYCKGKFGPRPKRRKKCPHCGNSIVHLVGKFYTEQQAGELYQKEWWRDSRSDVAEQVRDDYKENKSFEREFRETLTVGYIIKPGPHCPHVHHLRGLIVPLEDAKASPELLPPYDGCNHDTCECEYNEVGPGEVPRGTRVAQFSSPSRRSSSTAAVTRTTNRRQHKSAFPHVLHLVLTILTCGMWLPIWLIHYLIWASS